MVKKNGFKVVLVELWGIGWGIPELKDFIVETCCKFCGKTGADPKELVAFVMKNLDEIDGVIDQIICEGEGWA